MLTANCETVEVLDIVPIIRHGGVVAFPTDTVFGIGCDPFNKEAVEKVFEIKKRENKPLPVLCSDIAKVVKIVDLGESGLRLANRFWPGGLTIVATPLPPNLPKQLTSGSKGLGVRIPNHKGALNLITSCSGYLVGTSANISGRETLRTAEDIMKFFGNKLDALLYGGTTPSGLQSTVVSVVDSKVKILRSGIIPTELVLDTLREEKIRIGQEHIHINNV